MRNRKNNKRALIVSALSLLLCVSMLVGSTMAWFTDNASTGVNTIQAGTLDIQLLMQDSEGNWVNAENKTLEFIDKDDNKLWEPGCIYQLPALKVVNNGSLALKFKLVINRLSDDGAKLAEVLDVGTIAEGTFIPMGTTLAQLAVDPDGAAYGNLTAKAESDVYPLALRMQTTAGNEYQGLTLDGLSITVLAAQDTVESDSFGNTYDEGAEYDTSVLADVWDGTTAAVSAPETVTITNSEGVEEEITAIVVETAEELAGIAQTVNEGTTYENQTIVLTESVDLQGKDWSPMGSYSTGKHFKGTLDGQGHTVYNLNAGDGSASDQGFIGATNGAATVKNLNFVNADIDTTVRGAVVIGHAPGGSVTIDNITVTGDVKIHGLSQVATIVGSGGNANFNVSNVTVNVNEGSYVSNEGNTNQWDYVGGVMGQVWGASFKNISSNIDLIGQFGRGVGGVLAGAGGTVENVSCTGDITILTKDTVVSHTNSNENGNAYGNIQRWQQTGLISGHRMGATTFTNCTATGTLTYADDNTHTNGMYFYNSDGVKCEDNRFGAARSGGDNNVTIND